VLGDIPQVKHTYRHFMSRYSFMNEKGVAIASPPSASTHHRVREEAARRDVHEGRRPHRLLMAQDVALERAATAREAVQVMGTLVEEFGFLTETGGGGETMTVTDGTRPGWPSSTAATSGPPCASPRITCSWRPTGRASARSTWPTRRTSWRRRRSSRLPSSRGGSIQVGQAVRRPRDLCARRPGDLVPREWRVYDLIAPSLKAAGRPGAVSLLGEARQAAHARGHPADPGRLLRGDAYDMTKGPAPVLGRPDPLREPRGKGSFERSINVQRTYYCTSGRSTRRCRSRCADELVRLRGADTSYLTPLWAIMNELPASLGRGDRYGAFDRESGFWTNIYVQQMASCTTTRPSSTCARRASPAADALRGDAEGLEMAPARTRRTRPPPST